MISMRMYWLIKDHHLGNVPKEDETREIKSDSNFLDGLIMEMEKQKPQNHNFEPNLDVYD